MRCFILITKSFQMIILKRHFLVRSVALFKEIMPRTSIWSRVPISTLRQASRVNSSKGENPSLDFFFNEHKEVTNRYQTKTLYDNNKNNENNGITERNNDNNIKGIKKILKKYDFLNKNKLIENKIESNHKKASENESEDNFKSEYSSLIECTKQVIWIKRLKIKYKSKSTTSNKTDNNDKIDSNNENNKTKSNNKSITNTKKIKNKLVKMYKPTKTKNADIPLETPLDNEEEDTDYHYSIKKYKLYVNCSEKEFNNSYGISDELICVLKTLAYSLFTDEVGEE
ncbi:hypothetical protein H8356DRAFT_1437134 [Neocallimastix lanati (nom. inval.)]|nr:hypothetical protein H8356DRAFT_1437134 [Neocallimastix sp. JGI-2020a]